VTGGKKAVISKTKGGVKGDHITEGRGKKSLKIARSETTTKEDEYGESRRLRVFLGDSIQLSTKKLRGEGSNSRPCFRGLHFGKKGGEEKT